MQQMHEHKDPIIFCSYHLSKYQVQKKKKSNILRREEILLSIWEIIFIDVYVDSYTFNLLILQTEFPCHLIYTNNVLPYK